MQFSNRRYKTFGWEWMCKAYTVHKIMEQSLELEYSWKFANSCIWHWIIDPMVQFAASIPERLASAVSQLARSSWTAQSGGKGKGDATSRR